MIWNLMKLEIVIVYIDEWSFNPSSIPLYSWMKKGEQPMKIIRSTTDKYNSIAAQWKRIFTLWLKTKHQMRKVYEAL